MNGIGARVAEERICCVAVDVVVADFAQCQVIARPAVEFIITFASDRRGVVVVPLERVIAIQSQHRVEATAT